MRIIIPMKQVPETNAVRMDEETGTMVREGVEAILNPLDLYAVETALRIKDARPEGDCQIVGISMGPPKAVRALREAVAMGIDRGVLISDKAFAGSDTYATSYVLSAAIRKLGDFEMVICGERATDGDTGQVGPGIAGFLDLPVATYVSKLESISNGVARYHRLVEDGYEVQAVQLPAVLTVVKEISDPRLPTLRGKQRARKAGIPEWGLEDLDVERQKVGLKG